MNEIVLTLGPSRVGLSGAEDLVGAVAAMYPALVTRDAGRVAVGFELLQRRSSLVSGEPVVVGRGLRCTRTGADTIAVAVDLPPSQRLVPAPLYRLLHPACMDQVGYFTELFSDQLLYGSIQTRNLGQGVSFLHAAAVEREGQRVAVIGGGGVGKTGAALRLVLQHGFEYLSDDWTLLSSSQTIQPSWKPLMIFPRNLVHVGEPLPEGLFESRTDRWMWDRRIGTSGMLRRGLRRKVSAERLFGRPAGGGGPLSAALLVERGAASASFEPVSVEESGRFGAAIVMRELRESLAMLQRLEVIESAAVEGMEAATAEVLSAGLSRAELIKLTVPRAMPEPDVEDLIVRWIRTNA